MSLLGLTVSGELRGLSSRVEARHGHIRTPERPLICPADGIIAYTDRYLAARDVCPDYANLVRARIDKFVAWCGSEIRIGELHADLANEWLAELAAGGMNPRTLYGYRAALSCVWREAFERGDNDHSPLRLRRIKKPGLIIQAYTHDELRKILAHAATLKGEHPDGNQRSDFWQAAIHAGYALGSRRGDLLRLQREQIADDGAIRYVQNKTGYPAGGKLSIEALYFMRRLKSNAAALPWPYKRACFSRTFKRIRKAAGVHRGSFKWIRRSAGSYAETTGQGNGAKLLGHRSPQIFTLHYEDVAISGAVPVQPPPIQ